VVTLVVGVLNGRRVIPATAAVGDRWCVSDGLGLAIVTTREGRPAASRELVDLGGALIHTRIHHVISPFVGALASMVRPTRSLVVYNTGYRQCLRWMQVDQENVTSCLIRRHS